MKSSMLSKIVAVFCVLLTTGNQSYAQYRPHLLALDTPSDVSQTFEIAGFALNANVVHVWAWTPAGPRFVGWSDTRRFDIRRGWPEGHFSVTAVNMPVGIYPIVVYAYNAETQKFDSQAGRMYIIRPCAVSLLGPEMYAVPDNASQQWAFEACR